MTYITDAAEASRILGHPLDGPVYKAAREDGDGNVVAVPVFKIKKEDMGMKFRKRKKLKGIRLLFAGATLIMAPIWLMATLSGLAAQAGGPGYGGVEQTEDPEVVALTEEVAEIYPICPELLQAVIFYESGNQRAITSRWGDVGYMQVNPKWQQDRMDRLGVADLKDGYGNILVGTDFLCELFAEYEDPALALMAYNQGIDRALGLYNAGQVSSYASNVLELSERLERLHGK